MVAEMRYKRFYVYGHLLVSFALGYFSLMRYRLPAKAIFDIGTTISYDGFGCWPAPDASLRIVLYAWRISRFPGRHADI